MNRHVVKFESDANVLNGWLYKLSNESDPAPAVIWNHGTTKARLIRRTSSPPPSMKGASSFSPRCDVFKIPTWAAKRIMGRHTRLVNSRHEAVILRSVSDQSAYLARRVADDA